MIFGRKNSGRNSSSCLLGKTVRYHSIVKSLCACHSLSDAERREQSPMLLVEADVDGVTTRRLCKECYGVTVRSWEL